MLKIVVFDYGYGGEDFADRLEEQIPIVEIIRVIDWRHLEEAESNSRLARKYAKTALRPYIGKVDLIIFANHYLTITNLKYFQRKFKNQKFIGYKLVQPNNSSNRQLVILTTKPVTKTINYHNYIFRLKRKTQTMALDSWVPKINDGELEYSDVAAAFNNKNSISPSSKDTELILASSHFSDAKPLLKKYFGHNIKIHDSFNNTYRSACKVLKLRGGTGQKYSG